MADDRIAKQVDIVNLIRGQMLESVIRKLQFSKMDRYLIRNQSYPFTLSTMKVQSSDTSDFEPEKFVAKPSVYQTRLLRGVHYAKDKCEAIEPP